MVRAPHPAWKVQSIIGHHPSAFQAWLFIRAMRYPNGRARSLSVDLRARACVVLHLMARKWQEKKRSLKTLARASAMYGRDQTARFISLRMTKTASFSAS